MFDGVKSPILPILKPEWVVRQILNAMYRDKPTLYLPWYLGFFYVLRGIFPSRIWDFLSRVIGVNKTMDSFKGRGDNWALGKS